MSQRAEVEVEDSKQKKDVFLFREPIVLLAILCLPLSFGITAAIQIVKVKDVTDSTGLYQIWSLSGTAIPELGMVFFAFLSEIHGRKPIFIILYTLSIVSVILHLLPGQESIRFSFPFLGIVKGGALVMGTLAITEYCSPKHRFTYLMFNGMLLNTLYSLTSIVLTLEARLYQYVQAVQIVLMLACLLSACKWPESPYWLASQGRLVDSQEAFLWLRGEEGRKERNLLMEERRTPGPFKLYWISFFIAVATISVSVFTNLGDRFWIRWRIGRPKDIMTENILRSCGGIVIASLVSVLSYFVRRKLLFLLVCGISFILSYTMAIWVHVDSTVEDPSNLWFYFGYCTSDMISTFGPIELSVILCVELIPLKYNTHMACAVFLSRYVAYFPFVAFYWRHIGSFEESHAFLPLFTTLSLVSVIVYYCFAPETKGKTLLEIQKLYTPELSKANSKEDHDKIVTHI
uniref:Major facilitator superfamily (MFS) profile domain-containing protein n=1 Tax=Picea sitchensis TaxID=3332 RepID=B8LKJ1_PICSI|nr:unknown [Picea sitchensis]